MELATIEMPKAEARKAFLEYRRAVRERHNAEDEMIMRGYRALSQGHQVINLLDVMKAGGEDDLGRPRLAIARADEKRVVMHRWADGRFQMGPDVRGSVRSPSRLFNFPVDTMPREINPRTRQWQYAAIVPSVPPQYRPKADLSNYHILWEAEWTRAAPRDPALLKHAGGWIYVVLAVWDLTPLEQAVLGLTRN